MINKWIVTGDTHGVMKRFNFIEYEGHPCEVGVIILGDAGCNYYSDSRRHKIKKSLEKYGFHFYLIRGNHEERPENIEDIKAVYDERVCGEVYEEEKYPHIHYLKDGGIYSFDGHKTLVIGGAYSIDKWYRLQNGFPWFSQEQLTLNELAEIKNKTLGQDFDFIMTHTCPISWEPKDLFFDGIEQSTVDKTMELWMDNFKNEISWKIWLFGHFHGDRLERPRVEMYYQDMEEISTIWNRWNSNEPLDWWLQKSPNYWMN